MLIGHEVRAALAQSPGAIVQVIGAPDLTALYARAIATCGGYAERHDGEAAARGLAPDSGARGLDLKEPASEGLY